MKHGACPVITAHSLTELLMGGPSASIFASNEPFLTAGGIKLLTSLANLQFTPDWQIYLPPLLRTKNLHLAITPFPWLSVKLHIKAIKQAFDELQLLKQAHFVTLVINLL